MVLNADSGGTSAAARSMLSNTTKNQASMRRRRSKGTIAGFTFGKSSETPAGTRDIPEANGDPSATVEHANSITGSSMPGTQPQHSGDGASATPKPCHSARLALMCCQNAIRMGARTQLGLCPPGRARRGLKAALRQKARSNRISRNRTPPTQPSTDTGGYFGVDKMLGLKILEDYPAQEEDFLVTTNTFDAESDEEASSGDDDELSNLDALMQEDAPALDDEKKYANLSEPLFTPIGAESALANSTGGAMMGSMGTGKLPFNRRKLRYFDSITPADKMAAREYLTNETRRSKQREIALLAKHLKRAQRRERRRIKEERGIPLIDADLSDQEDDTKEMALVPANVSKFEHAMLPSTAAALVLESLALNPLESVEGMAKCYEGIVAAGVALLESNVNDPTSPMNENERRAGTRAEIMAALAPLLITSLEQPSGDVIISMARLRRMCGTPRYQRRFVQRVAPSLIRPPKGAMWCLRHQNDMEPILAAAELIFDCATEIFSKGWYDRGQLLLADTKRAETLNTAAMQLRSLRTGPGETLTLGNTLGGHGGWRSTRVHKDGAKGSNESLAEWEVIAVDRQIRISISNIITQDWSRVVVQSRDLELARSYHRSRSTRRQSVLLSSPSSEMSPKTTAVTPLSPARPSIIKTMNSPVAPPAPSSDKQEPSDSSFTPLFSANEPSETRSRSPAPLTPPAPSQHPPLSPPPPNRTSAEDQFSGSSNFFSIPAPPRSPTSKSPKVFEPDVPPAPTFKSSPLSPNVRGATPNPQFKESISGPQISSPGPPQAEKITAPLSPSSFGGNSSSDNIPARFMSSVSSTGSSLLGTMGTQPAHYRMLTSTAAERKRTVAACRALRAQITRFEDAFIQLHGRPPKGAAERAPLATTYAQYREWKRAIRADAACRIQALFRGARARWRLLRSNEPRISRIIMSKAGRQEFNDLHSEPQPPGQDSMLKQLSIPVDIGGPIEKSQDIGQPTGIGTVGPDGFPTQSTNAQALAPQWGNQVVRRRPAGPPDSFGALSPVPRPISSPSSASVSSSGSGEFSRLSLSELQARKRELKQQLKQYDMSFARRHGRMPVKAEKEPIRHLYERYNALKSQITSMEQETGRSGGPSPTLMPQATPAVLPQRTISPVSSTTSGNEDSPSTSRKSKTAQRTPPGSTGVPAGAPSQDLAALKAEKQRLHQMLRAYEKDFFKEHKRQVSSFADIRPVASNYRRYKEIKKAIAAIVQQGGER